MKRRAHQYILQQRRRKRPHIKPHTVLETFDANTMFRTDAENVVLGTAKVVEFNGGGRGMIVDVAFDDEATREFSISLNPVERLKNKEALI